MTENNVRCRAACSPLGLRQINARFHASMVCKDFGSSSNNLLEANRWKSRPLAVPWPTAGLLATSVEKKQTEQGRHLVLYGNKAGCFEGLANHTIAS